MRLVQCAVTIFTALTSDDVTDQITAVMESLYFFSEVNGIIVELLKHQNPGVGYNINQYCIALASNEFKNYIDSSFPLRLPLLSLPQVP
jgi:hypothetical protein